MTVSPSSMIAEILRTDLLAFIHRSFIELNPAATFEYNWHHELIRNPSKTLLMAIATFDHQCSAATSEAHSTSIAFPAWFLGHFPEKQVACVSYTQDFSDTLARNSRRLMNSAFYE